MSEDQGKPIYLTFRSVEQVVVEPDDQDRFVTTAREAARACQSAQEYNVWQKQFDSFLSFVHEWCQERSEKVEAGYVDIGDGGLRVSICTLDDDFDFDFDDEVTELDIALANRFPQCVSEVTQIPKQVSQQMEFATNMAIVVYGDTGAASVASGS